MIYTCNHTFIENQTDSLDIFDNNNNFYNISKAEKENISFACTRWIDFDVLTLSRKNVINCLKTITAQGIFKYYNKTGKISTIRF